MDYDNNIEEVHTSHSNNSHSVEEDKEYVEDTFIPVTPRTVVKAHSGYHISAIPGVEEIEKMSGPLLRGYLKSVGIECKGKRPELMGLLTREFMRYEENPETYLEAIKADMKEPKSVVFEPESSTRRTKKRSLKAREADEGKEGKKAAVEVVKKSARIVNNNLMNNNNNDNNNNNNKRAAAPLSAATAVPTTAAGADTLKKARKNSLNDLNDELRLARYDLIARQCVWGNMQHNPGSKMEAMKRFCELFGYNSQGEEFVEADEKHVNPEFESNLMGRRIEVLWVSDTSNKSMWYAGTICGVVNGSKKIFTVLYDDGEERDESLRSKNWRFCKKYVSFNK
jgi:hypothetical protein